MEGAGWSRGSDGIWAKDGREAEMTIVSLAGNKRRELTEQVLQQQLGDAGFRLTIRNTTPADLFAKVAPSGSFQLGLWTLIDTYPEPSLSASFSSTSIPTKANGNSGINFFRIDIPGLDDLLRTVDVSIDQDERRAASLEADRLIAEAVPSLPIATVPNVLMTSESLGGPISINPSEGPFWNLEEWTRG
jgi:peptide/nickel transport system substrate-binding protein